MRSRIAEKRSAGEGASTVRTRGGTTGRACGSMPAERPIRRRVDDGGRIDPTGGGGMRRTTSEYALWNEAVANYNETHQISATILWRPSNATNSCRSIFAVQLELDRMRAFRLICGSAMMCAVAACVAQFQANVRVTSTGYEMNGRPFASASEVAREVVNLKPAAVHVDACSNVQTRRVVDMLNELKRGFDGPTSINTVACNG